MVSYPSTFDCIGQPLISRVTSSWNTVPSRCFSHPQGLFPPNTFRPYFMPLPSMGFYHEDYFPKTEPFALSGIDSLLWFICQLFLPQLHCTTRLGCWAIHWITFHWQHFDWPTPLQGFHLCSRSVSSVDWLGLTNDRNPQSLSFLGVSPFAPEVYLEPLSSHVFNW